MNSAAAAFTQRRSAAAVLQDFTAAAAVWPVSYTHLDVSKRQAMYYRVLNQDGHERLPALSLDAEAKANVYKNMRELKLL